MTQVVRSNQMTRRLALALPLIGCRKHAASDATWKWAYNGRSWQYSRIDIRRTRTSSGTQAVEEWALLYAVVEPSRQYPGMWNAYEWDERTLGPGRTIVLTVTLDEAKRRVEKFYPK